MLQEMFNMPSALVFSHCHPSLANLLHHTPNNPILPFTAPPNHHHDHEVLLSHSNPAAASTSECVRANLHSREYMHIHHLARIRPPCYPLALRTEAF